MNDKRTPNDILADLVKEVMEYNSLRDTEMDWEGEPEDWDDEVADGYNDLIDDISKSRGRVEALLREATGDETLDF